MEGKTLLFFHMGGERYVTPIGIRHYHIFPARVYKDNNVFPSYYLLQGK